MGMWGHGILDSDDAADFQEEFEELFGSKDDPEGPLYKMPTAEESTLLLRLYEGDFMGKQVLAYMLMARGAPMSQEVKTAGIEGCQLELNGLGDHVPGPERREVLEEHKRLIELYPLEGKNVMMPPQTNLVQEMLNKLNPDGI